MDHDYEDLNDEQKRALHTKEMKRLGKMSVEQLKEELDMRIKSSLIEEIKKLPQRINEHMEHAAWQIISVSLGMKKDTWHDSVWEIDSHHQNAALAVALGNHALSQVKQAIPDFIAGLVVGDPRIPPIKTAYTKAYKEKLAELVHHEMWNHAQKNAEKRFAEIMAEITGEPDESEGGDNDDEAEGEGVEQVSPEIE